VLECVASDYEYRAEIYGKQPSAECRNLARHEKSKAEACRAAIHALTTYLPKRCGWRGMGGGEGCVQPHGHDGGHGFSDGSGGNTCYHCGEELVRDCMICGAPNCCPRCCQETTREIFQSQRIAVGTANEKPLCPSSLTPETDAMVAADLHRLEDDETCPASAYWRMVELTRTLERERDEWRKKAVDLHARHKGALDAVHQLSVSALQTSWLYSGKEHVEKLMREIAAISSENIVKSP
jgi:hypothetical protein